MNFKARILVKYNLWMLQALSLIDLKKLLWLTPRPSPECLLSWALREMCVSNVAMQPLTVHLEAQADARDSFALAKPTKQLFTEIPGDRHQQNIQRERLHKTPMACPHC